MVTVFELSYKLAALLGQAENFKISSMLVVIADQNHNPHLIK